MAGTSVLIVAPASVEASLLTRRLTRWGADVHRADAHVMTEAGASRRFDVVLIDHTADAAAAVLRGIGESIARRIVLLTPSGRHHLPALKAAGSTSYLVKPVRAASLAARLDGDAHFEDSAPELPPIGTPSSGKSLAVLVAEDNGINALLARSLLGKLGHRPTVATDGAAAFAAWRAAQADGTPYDVVLMDVQMPGTDGLEATRQIRAAEAAMELAHTPIVALTANAFADDRDTCLAAGMDEFLVKPLDRDRLAALLAELPGRAALAA